MKIGLQIEEKASCEHEIIVEVPDGWDDERLNEMMDTATDGPCSGGLDDVVENLKKMPGVKVIESTDGCGGGDVDEIEVIDYRIIED